MKKGRHVFYILKSEKANKFYFGSSSDLDKRLKTHFRQLKSGIHHNVFVQDIWDRYLDWTISSYVTFPTAAEAKSFEERMIHSFSNSDTLTNIGRHASGGDNLTKHPRKKEITKKRGETYKAKRRELKVSDPSEFFRRYQEPKLGEKNPMYGKTHSEEVRKVISIRHKGKIPPNKGVPMSEDQKKLLSERAPRRFGKDNHFYGKKHSDEVKERLRKASTGRVNDIGHIISIDNVVYPSYWNASNKLGIPLVTIRHRCLSKNPKFENYKLISKRQTTIESTPTDKTGGSE
jgi:group I intron endonuclease